VRRYAPPGFCLRQGRVKVREAEGKVLKIDTMEYNTRNITHLQRKDGLAEHLELELG
jgi:hypothetical protein